MSKTMELARDVIARYGDSGTRLVVAESCTAGLLCGALTEVPSASKILDRGYVTYSNDAKVEDLGVPRDLIDQHGAVSAEVACAMADGALNKAYADIAIGITGIAGPSGGSAEKPVGLVYIGCKKKNEDAQSHKFIFGGDRHEVREQSIIEALRILLQCHAA